MDVSAAKVLHFAGPVKPWMPTAMLRWTAGDPRIPPTRVVQRWWNACIECLAAARMRNAAAKLRT